MFLFRCTRYGAAWTLARKAGTVGSEHKISHIHGKVNTRKHDIFERGCICTLALVCRCDPDLREQPLNRSRCRRAAEILILILPRHHCHVREFLSVRLMLLVFCVLCLTLASKLNVSQCLLEFPVFLTLTVANRITLFFLNVTYL